jgi:hypothetical protein
MNEKFRIIETMEIKIIIIENQFTNEKLGINGIMEILFIGEYIY